MVSGRARLQPCPHWLGNPGFRWDETAGLAERAMMLSAAHSKCKLKETSHEEDYQRKRIGVEGETGWDRRGGLRGPIQLLLCVERRRRGHGRRAYTDQRGGVSAALGSRTAAAHRHGNRDALALDQPSAAGFRPSGDRG